MAHTDFARRRPPNRRGARFAHRITQTDAHLPADTLAPGGEAGLG